MSKADTLLKRAGFYEKMALYSDRKTFLQAVAQAAPASDPNRQLINKALQLLQQSGADEATTAPLVSAITFNKVDVPAIRKSIQTAILTGKLSPLSHGPEIQELKNISSQLKTESELAMAGPADMEFIPDPKADQIKARAYPPVPVDVQNALNKLMGAGLKPDGQLGPQTRKALDAFRGQYNVPGNFSDQEVFQVIKNTASR
jgi:peptidoglycan hydrolase-like protein with peptidoglycan-binding domain